MFSRTHILGFSHVSSPLYFCHSVCFCSFSRYQSQGFSDGVSSSLQPVVHCCVSLFLWRLCSVCCLICGPWDDLFKCPSFSLCAVKRRWLCSLKVLAHGLNSKKRIGDEAVGLWTWVPNKALYAWSRICLANHNSCNCEEIAVVAFCVLGPTHSTLFSGLTLGRRLYFRPWNKILWL